MMRTFVKTLIGGAVGAAALYAVAKIAFQAGHDLAEAECRYEQLTSAKEEKEEEQPSEETPAEMEVKRGGKLGLIWGARKLFKGKGGNVVGELIHNPENHVIEARIKGRELHVNVRPKDA